MHWKSILNSITEGYEAEDPEYFQLYEESQQLGEEIKHLQQENNHLKIEIDNMTKDQLKLKDNFFNISQNILKKRPIKADTNGQIKTKMRLNELKARIKGHEYLIKYLNEEQKSVSVDQLENQCLQLQLEQIAINSGVLECNLRLRVMETVDAKLPIDARDEIQEMDWEDCNRIDKIKATKAESLHKLENAMEAIEEEIARELRIQAKLKDNKARNSEAHKAYNKMIEQRGAYSKSDSNLTWEIDRMNTEMGRVKGQL